MKHPYNYYSFRKKMNNINWIYLTMNPLSISLLEKYPDKIDLIWLLSPSAITILEKSPESLECEWNYLLSRKQSMFVLNYKIIKEDRRELNEEIIQYFYHPTRINKWLESGKTMDEFYNIYH